MAQIKNFVKRAKSYGLGCIRKWGRKEINWKRQKGSARGKQLFDGECWKVVACLHQAGLPDHAAYFEQHLRRMDYPAFRAQALPIGSGATESAVKQYKQRLCGPGMRWLRRGLERMVAIRSAVLNRSFHTHWLAA
jgi:hypothetical protein